MSVNYYARGDDFTLADITNLVGSHPVKTDTASISTNSNGQAALTDYYASTHFILGVYTMTNTTTRITPYIGAVTGQWWISARKVSDDSKVVNTALDVVIAYIDL